MQVLNSSDFYKGHCASNCQRLHNSNITSLQSQLLRSRTGEVQDGLQIFQTSLSKSYQKFSIQTVVPVTEVENKPLSAETVANNILSFIEQRLRRDEAAGASKEELEERLAQGLEGFSKGFAEAREKIESLNLLNDEVRESIDKTYDLVTGGIEDLRARFIEGIQPAEEEPSVNKEPSANTEAVKGDMALSAGYGQVRYGQTNFLKFEVETADGDVVTIKARSKQLYAMEYRTGSYVTGDGAGAFEQFDSRSVQNSRFHMQVVGELDEDELQALEQLLGKLEDLSTDFFAGDLDSAFNQALNLGYDSEEIVGYSLNLRQVEVQQVAVAYQQAGNTTTSVNPMANKLEPLGRFAADLLDAVNTGSVFADPINLLANLSEQMSFYRADREAGPADDDRFSRFVKDMLDAIPRLGQDTAR